MSKTLSLLALVLIGFACLSYSGTQSAEQAMQKGIANHDAGKFDQAVADYALPDAPNRTEIEKFIQSL